MGRVGQILPSFPPGGVHAGSASVASFRLCALYGGVHAGRVSVPSLVGTSRQGPRPSAAQSSTAAAPRTHPTRVELGPGPPSPHASALHSGGVRTHGLVQSKPPLRGPEAHAAFVSPTPRRAPQWTVSGTPVGHVDATPPVQVAMASGVHSAPAPASSGTHANPEAAPTGKAAQACDPLPAQSKAVSPLLHASTEPVQADGALPSAHPLPPPTPQVPPLVVGLHVSPQRAQFSP